MAIDIPKNPITQQPNGTKPPITYFNKENKDPQGGSEVQKRSPDKRINEPCDEAEANTRKDVQPLRGINKLTTGYINNYITHLTYSHFYE